MSNSLTTYKKGIIIEAVDDLCIFLLWETERGYKSVDYVNSNATAPLIEGDIVLLSFLDYCHIQ
ncbi:MAG: hypothetical protein M3270_11185 [Thermoproteota archaeon]|nr:hypothetical protein [Thermoproteota archaeon]